MFNPIQFKGFDPTGDLKAFAKRMFGEVEEFSPSDAASEVKVYKTRRGFEGLLKVNSFSGSFAAYMSGKDPSLVISGLCRQMRQQILRWRERRF